MTRRDVQGKLDHVRERLGRLERLRAVPPIEFAADFRNVDAALHGLQTAIEALLDIGAHLIGDRGLPTPASRGEILATLAGAGLLPAHGLATWRKMVGFRNRVVHGYDAVDPDLLRSVLDEHLGDLHALADHLDAALPGP